MQNKQVEIYTDGAASGNPGPGGYGVVMMAGHHRKELSEGFRHTTNNRMELLAVIRGLEALKRSDLQIRVYTDSRYVSDAVNQGWLENWKRRSFKKVKNVDLWKKFIELYDIYRPEFIWVKGHADNKENERCDRLAVEASHSADLKEDEGYILGEDEKLISFF